MTRAHEITRESCHVGLGTGAPGSHHTSSSLRGVRAPGEFMKMQFLDPFPESRVQPAVGSGIRISRGPAHSEAGGNNLETLDPISAVGLFLAVGLEGAGRRGASCPN